MPHCLRALTKRQFDVCFLEERTEMKIYVGNLAYRTVSDGLRAAFEQFGVVTSAEVVIDRETNRSKGFGFVVMPNDDEARVAIENLDGAELDQRALRVNEARASEPRRNMRGNRNSYR